MNSSEDWWDCSDQPFVNLNGDSLKIEVDESVAKEKKSKVLLYVPPHQRTSISSEIFSDKNSKMVITCPEYNDSLSLNKKKNKNKNNLECMLKTDLPSQKKIKNKPDNPLERILELAERYLNEKFKSQINEIYFQKYKSNLPENWLKTLKFSVIIDDQTKVVKDQSLIQNINDSKKNVQDLIDTNSNNEIFITSKSVKNCEVMKHQCTKNTLIEDATTIQVFNSPSIKSSKKDFEKNTARNLEFNFNKLFKNKNVPAELLQNTPQKLDFPETDPSPKLNKFLNLPDEQMLMKPSDFKIIDSLNPCCTIFSPNKSNSSLRLIDNAPKDQISDNNFSAQLQNKLLNIGPKNFNLSNLEKEFTVIIHSCKNLLEIWGKIIDENTGNLVELSNEMALFYISEKPGKISIQENFYYALYDKSWHRVKCLKTDGTIATVFFIDRGDKNSYPNEKLFKLDYKFCLLPSQAIKMTLSDLDLFSECDNMYAILHDLLHEKIFYAKVDHFKENNNCLSVKLYYSKDCKINVNEIIKREISNYSPSDRSVKNIEKKIIKTETEFISQESVISASLHKNKQEKHTEIPTKVTEKNELTQNNKSANKDHSGLLKKIDVQKNLGTNKIKKKSSENIAFEEYHLLHSILKLKHPDVPNDYSYFDVTVLMVRDPSYIIVMRREKMTDFQKMMKELETFCLTNNNPKCTYKITEKKLYGCKSSENDPEWCRVFVTNIQDDQICTVYFCDHGKYKKVNVGNLVPLSEQFYELPYQAICVQLWGIEPAFGEWNKSDRSSLKDLIDKKNLVCMARKRKFLSEKNLDLRKIEMEIVYELEMIDTNTDEDINISIELVNQGRAKKKNSS